MSTPALSPRPRETSSYATQARPRLSPTPIPRPTVARTPAASLAPRCVNGLKSPARPVDPRTPSPNYFGLQVDANKDVFASSAAQHIRSNWSPPSSKVRSTAAASPSIIPADQNPEFEQFRKHLDTSRGFSLGAFDFGPSRPSIPAPRGSVSGRMRRPSLPAAEQAPSESTPSPDGFKGQPGSSEKQRSPKRLFPAESDVFPDQPRRNSPASFLDKEGYGHTDELAKFADDSKVRPSLPAARPSAAKSLSHHRAETLPATFPDENRDEGPHFVTPQHIINILESCVEEVLLLDLRVSTQYAKARIAGALSLCIPTTLLKRPSFNVQKLAETFQDQEQRQKFENWRSSKHIIVYDANSSQTKDATICINTLKKFASEGWQGGSYIVRGGFQEFANKFPAWITRGSSQAAKGPLAVQTDAELPAVAPVIGGCPMPQTQNAANPFFGNIRQNMDLIGGVGQMSIKLPATMTEQMEQDLPRWLRVTTNSADNGKTVADKFLQIEKREQKRMQEALSDKVVYGTPAHGPTMAKSVQIAGIEKGSKNRYNSIWPYEHSRVKLEGVRDGGCDYVNANHVSSAFSNRRYIATQGPLPATFNDFWNMVWQQDVRVIVMLTAEQEGGQLKAHNYWSGNHFGHLHLDRLGERRASLEPAKIRKRGEQHRPSLGPRRSTNPTHSPELKKDASIGPAGADQPYVTVRKFTLSNDEAPFERMREITQLQYSHWPDFGAPAHPTHLLGLIEQCDAVCRQVNGVSPTGPEPPETRPILVHCSAGCGRTGTFCTTDSVLDMLKRQRQARNARQQKASADVGGALTEGRSQSSAMRAMSMNDEPARRRQSTSSDERDDEAWIYSEDLDLIAKTVEDFRMQRLSMVQSLRQFVLCYESVLEWMVERTPKSA